MGSTSTARGGVGCQVRSIRCGDCPDGSNGGAKGACCGAGASWAQACGEVLRVAAASTGVPGGGGGTEIGATDTSDDVSSNATASGRTRSWSTFPCCDGDTLEHPAAPPSSTAAEPTHVRSFRFSRKVLKVPLTDGPQPAGRTYTSPSSVSARWVRTVSVRITAGAVNQLSDV